jgi:hypothetical protein
MMNTRVQLIELGLVATLGLTLAAGELRDVATRFVSLNPHLDLLNLNR